MKYTLNKTELPSNPKPSDWIRTGCRVLMTHEIPESQPFCIHPDLDLQRITVVTGNGTGEHTAVCSDSPDYAYCAEKETPHLLAPAAMMDGSIHIIAAPVYIHALLDRETPAAVIFRELAGKWLTATKGQDGTVHISECGSVDTSFSWEDIDSRALTEACQTHIR